MPPMSEVTRILSALEEGDPSAAAEQLLPPVYVELRKPAGYNLARDVRQIRESEEAP
jgi:ECF sigma factor